MPDTTNYVRDSVDRDGNIIAVVLMAPQQAAAFRLESGELLEANECNDGVWDWDSAGICDPMRGENAELQAALRATLSALTREVNPTNTKESNEMTDPIDEFMAKGSTVQFLGGERVWLANDVDGTPAAALANWDAALHTAWKRSDPTDSARVVLSLPEPFETACAVVGGGRLLAVMETATPAGTVPWAMPLDVYEDFTLRNQLVDFVDAAPWAVETRQPDDSEERIALIEQLGKVKTALADFATVWEKSGLPADVVANWPAWLPSLDDAVADVGDMQVRNADDPVPTAPAGEWALNLHLVFRGADTLDDARERREELSRLLFTEEDVLTVVSSPARPVGSSGAAVGAEA